RSRRKSPRSSAAPRLSDQPIPAARIEPLPQSRFKLEETTMNQGKIVQIIGAVVDVEFPRENVPKVYDALKVQNTDITLEVPQQLGGGIVGGIALGATDGLKRNLIADNTGRGISVPVGMGTLGRIMDVLGTPID